MRKRNIFKDIKSFNMIELMIVVVVIGILSAIAIPKFQQAIEEAKIKEAQSVLKSIRNAEKVFKAERRVYVGVDVDPANYFPHPNGICPNNPPGNTCDNKNRAWSLLRIEEITDTSDWQYGVATEDAVVLQLAPCNTNGVVGVGTVTTNINQACIPFALRRIGPNAGNIFYIQMTDGLITPYVADFSGVDCAATQQ